MFDNLSNIFLQINDAKPQEILESLVGMEEKQSGFSPTDTIGLVVAVMTAIGLGFSFWWNSRQLKSTIKGLKQEAYAKIRDEHLVQKRLMMNDDLFRKVFTLKGTPEPTDWTELSVKEKKKIILFLIAEIDLYDRIYWEFKKRNISTEEWVTWLIWIKMMSHSPLFKEALNEVRTTYFDESMEAIEKNIIKNEIFCPACKEKFDDLMLF